MDHCLLMNWGELKRFSHVGRVVKFQVNGVQVIFYKKIPDINASLFEVSPDVG